MKDRHKQRLDGLKGEVVRQLRAEPALATGPMIHYALRVATRPLEEIHDLMDGTEWNDETLAGIAKVMQEAGFDVSPHVPKQKPPPPPEDKSTSEPWRAQILLGVGGLARWASMCRSDGEPYCFPTAKGAAQALRTWYPDKYRRDRLDKASNEVRVFNQETGESGPAWLHA